MSEFFKQIHRADRVLSSAGWLNLAIVLFALIAAPWDDASLLKLGANPWKKVIRYSAALVIYAWSLALYLQYLTAAPKPLLRAIRWGTFLCLAVTALGILAQAMRGVPSHYNISGTGNTALFLAIVGAMFVNSLIAFLILFLFLWEEIEMPRAYLMGIRLGFVLFSIGSLAGMIMMINQGHTVGAADGGPGLPFLEWSTTAGDLRVAHLAGIFGLQVLPLAGFILHRLMKDRQTVAQLVIVTGIAGLWVLFFIRVFQMAVAGKPLIALS